LQVHPEENELVVKDVLAEAGVRGFALYDPFPGWGRRGLPLCPGSQLLVRTDPDEDGTDGFFVAAFARLQEIR
jgi:putative methyltransferase